MTYKDLVDIIEQPWIDVDGIMKLAKCGRYCATRTIRKVQKRMIESGNDLPTVYALRVPTKALLEYLGLSEDFIYKMAEREDNSESAKR